MNALMRRPMAVLSAAHLCDDVNQSYIAALLPFLTAQRHLSFTAAAELVLAANISSSVVQPAIGMLADRYSLWWLIPAGLLLAGCGVAAIGPAPNFAVMFCAALVSGLGIAMFHPEGARIAARVAGAKKASGMRWFAAGGNIGFAIGPAFAALSVGAFGLRGTLLAAIPAAGAALVAALEMRRLLPRLAAARAKTSQPQTAADDWSAFMRLGWFITLRSMAFIGLVGFVPLYFVHVLGTSPFTASAALTLLLAAGAAGTIAGGPLADHYGRRTIVRVSTGASAVILGILTPLTLHLAGSAPAVPVAIAGFALLGFVMVACTASFVVLGQEYLPNRTGLASGVTLGLAISLGGIASPGLGAIGDTWGLGATLSMIGCLTAAAFAAALTLPQPRAWAAPSAEAAAAAAMVTP